MDYAVYLIYNLIDCFVGGSPRLLALHCSNIGPGHCDVLHYKNFRFLLFVFIRGTILV